MSVSVLVMGRTKTGKSTFINALIGESLLPARATSGTALVTEIGYGNDTEHIKVFYTDSDTPMIISHDRFLKEFSISQEEQDALYDNGGGKLDRFSNVSHAEMHTNSPLFPAGVRLIDTPALEEAWYYNPALAYGCYKLTNEYLSKANAIIFLLNATAMFSVNEKEYIKENFAGKHLQNVFFVVNRINQIVESLEENVIPCVRNGLSAVFTDENGRFDEDLFQKRVFYVDAYGARCARTGEPYKVCFGRKVIEIPIGIEKTGFPEFESALWQYLRSCVGCGRK